MKKMTYLAGIIPLLCNPAGAIELGPLTAQSYLHEPFRAVLHVTNATDLEWADVRFKMANSSTYQRFGMFPPTNLGAIKLKLSATDNGGYQVNLSSHHRVVEPILNILIEVVEKQGSFFREYTLLMDPPESTSIKQPPPVAVEKPPAATAGSKPTAKPPAPATAPDASSTTILVKNQSISIIAQNSEWHPQYSVYQIMRALYQANPRAFEKGNINKLRSGSRLTVPAESVIAAVARQKAVNFVYSVSKDKSPQTGQEVRSRQTQNAVQIAQKQPDTFASETHTAQRTRFADTQMPSDLAADIKTWRSISDEFGSLSAIVDRHNGALRTQIDAIQDMYQNLDDQQARIEQLSTQLNELQTHLSRTGSQPLEPISPPQQADPRDQNLTRQQQEIARLEDLLRQ